MVADVPSRALGVRYDEGCPPCREALAATIVEAHPSPPAPASSRLRFRSRRHVLDRIVDGHDKRARVPERSRSCRRMKQFDGRRLHMDRKKELLAPDWPKCRKTARENPNMGTEV